jgi:hypothetical protein
MSESASALEVQLSVALAERDEALARVAMLRGTLEPVNRAIESLMNEVTHKKATDWGLVNDTSVAVSRALAATADSGAWLQEHDAKVRLEVLKSILAAVDEAGVSPELKVAIGAAAIRARGGRGVSP